MMYINLKEIVTDIKADLLRKGISNIYFNLIDYQIFDVTTVHHVIIGSKMYQTLMFSSIYSTDDNLMNHLEKMVNQLSDVRVPIVISILALTRTDKENRLYYTVLYIYMNEKISKQRLAAALKKYKAENSIPNIYFFINNYRNKYPYNFNFIKICGKEYELKYVTIVSNSNYISELIGRKNLYTKDVYFHIDNYGVSSNYFKFEDKKNGYYTTYNTPESVRLEKCLQNILVDKIREIRKDDTAHIISFINVSYDNNKKIVLTMAIATKALI